MLHCFLKSFSLLCIERLYSLPVNGQCLEIFAHTFCIQSFLYLKIRKFSKKSILETNSDLLQKINKESRLVRFMKTVVKYFMTLSLKVWLTLQYTVEPELSSPKKAAHWFLSCKPSPREGFCLVFLDVVAIPSFDNIRGEPEKPIIKFPYTQLLVACSWHWFL